ncbi:MAG TPA: hypothetical protein VGM82_18515 [Gemmatimonadaceae bacterium]|jgi:hypothetical protein
MRVPSLKTLAPIAALVSLAACQTAPIAHTAVTQPVATSAAAPVLTSILARNFGAYDAGIFAVADNGKAIWLTNVPAGGTRKIPVVARDLQMNGLVLRVQAIGSGRSWTSAATLIDGQTTGVLDLTADHVGNPLGTLLRFVPTAAYVTEIR